jgi:hypothetical protein
MLKPEKYASFLVEYSRMMANRIVGELVLA